MRFSGQDLRSRYRESFLGPAWALVVPLCQLAVFSFVFTSILHSRWSGGEAGSFLFPLNLFCGISVYSVFSEIVTRSTTILSENSSYIKRVVFPLEVMPISIVLTALIGFLISLSILLVGYCIIRESLPPVQALSLPLILVPFFVLLAGLAWLLAGISVYLPDFRHAIFPIVSLLMFLSPVLFPLSSVPEPYRFAIAWNPVTVPIEQLRNALLLGTWPDPLLLAGYAAVAWAVAWLGYATFAVLRRGFADVV
ncbi:ABC transporter permease [Bradyrhizobium septentrionale]|uniref:ABC transporter permease n=1 Tax=Bradyrhizobium septentrionale TaxID=1404411 RepID=UPI0030D36507